jgi:uncharacterized membrane protein
MLVQIAVLAWLFLGEQLSLNNVIGLVLATIGVLIVQVAPKLRLRSLQTKN